MTENGFADRMGDTSLFELVSEGDVFKSMPGHVQETMDLAERYLPAWACEILKRGWDHSKHPRDEHGRFTSGPGMASASDVHEVTDDVPMARDSDVHQIGANARTKPPKLPKRAPRHEGFHRQKANKASPDLSREYLEEALAAAREHLPGWAYALMHQKALPKSGGRSKGRAKPTPDTLSQVAMRKLTREDLADIPDNELLGVWGQMQSWYRGNSDDDLYQAANAVIDELEGRGVQVDTSSGLGADATVRKAIDDGVTPVETLADAAAWLVEHGGGDVRPLSRCSRWSPVASVPDLALAARRAMDAPGSQGVVLRRDGGAVFLAKSAYGDVQRFVPTSGPRRAPVAFIGATPTACDAARGEPFTGGDGAALVEHYLAPLGLAKRDVMLANLLPMVGHEDAAIFDRWIEQELAAYRPRVVVALGRVAKAALGPRAGFFLPHPAVVRKHGDKGEIARKLVAIKAAIDAASQLTHEVSIAKADSRQQICYGVVLDPYQIDTQGDWCPAKDIEKTAHDYMETSRVVGLQHGKVADAVVVESHVVHYPSQQDYDAAMANLPHRAYRMPFGDQVVHSGSWILGTKVRDPKTWADIEKGAVAAYSIGGDGVRTKMRAEDMPKVQFVDLRAELVPGSEPGQVPK